jgi:hypothetical protein
MALNQIINVVTVGHDLVSTTGTVVMAGFVAVAMVLGRTTFRILPADIQGMLLDHGWAWGVDGMMEMAVVKIIDVAAMFDGGMAAVRAVLMTVIGMAFWIAHNWWIRIKLANFYQNTMIRTKIDP